MSLRDLGNGRDDDEDESSGPSLSDLAEVHRGRWLRVSIFVLLLAVMDLVYLRWAFSPNAPDAVLTFGGVFLRIFILAAIGSVPFFVMAWLDPVWRSKHAAWIAAGTWIVVFTLFSNSKWGATCPGAAMFFFVPFSIGALVGHNLGMFRHPETFDQEDLDR